MSAFAGGEWQGVFAAWLANQVLVRGTLVLVAALLVTRLLGRRSASVRHSVWLLALAVLVLGGVMSWPDRAAGSGAAVVAPVSGDGIRRSAPVSANAAGPVTIRPVRADRVPWHATIPDAWVWVWLAGASLLLLGLGRDVRSARRLARSATVPRPELAALFEEIRGTVCPGTAVRVRIHADVSVPLVVGGGRPVVLLPPWAQSWSAERLRSTFRHELAHVVRRDYPLHLLSGAILAVYWATPLAWLARRYLDREREAACDERVIAWGTRPAEYAQHLLDVARDARRGQCHPATALAGRGPGLAWRVRTVLTGRAGRNWSRAAWGIALATALLATIVIAGIAPIQTRREARRADALRQLAADRPDTRRHAAWMLGELESLEDVAALENALADPDAQVRAAAAWALGEIKDPASGPALAARLDDADARVREIAALSIGEIGDPAGVQPLLGATARHAHLDGAVRWALREIGGEALLRRNRLLTGTDRPPDRDVWAGAMPEPSPEMTPASQVPGLIGQLTATESRLRVAAAVALGRAGDERAVDPLLDALTDASAEVRAAAVWALDEINPSR